MPCSLHNIAAETDVIDAIKYFQPRTRKKWGKIALKQKRNDHTFIIKRTRGRQKREKN